MSVILVIINLTVSERRTRVLSLILSQTQGQRSRSNMPTGTSIRLREPIKVHYGVRLHIVIWPVVFKLWAIC